MATYEEIGSGGCYAGGCAAIKHTKYVLIPFGVRDIVCVRRSAMRGIIEKVCIKRVNIEKDTTTNILLGINYTDTQNRIWMEDELIAYSTAEEIAVAHNQETLNLAQTLLMKCKT